MNTNSSLRPESTPVRALMLACAFALTLVASACEDDQAKMEGFLKQANGYLENEEFAEAIIEYGNVLQLDPSNVEAHRELAKAYFKTDELRKGYWELSETVRLDPTDIDSRIQYTALTMAGGQFDEVLVSADQILEIEPENATAHLFRGQALLGLERPSEAQEAMERAVALEPGEAGGHLALASLYQSQGDAERAEAQVLESLRQDPVTLGHTMMAALLNARQADEAEIEAQLISARDVALSPKEDGSQQQELVAAYRNLAAFYFDRERTEEGVLLLEQAIETVSEGREELNTILVSHFRRSGQRERAHAALERSTLFDPSDASPWLLLSNLRAQHGDDEGAMDAAEAALLADPESLVANLRKTELLINQAASEEDTELMMEARQAIEADREANPSSPEAAFVAGKLELAAGNLDLAIGHLRDALEIQPNWSQAHFVLGSVLLMNGEPKRARASLARAVELYPDFDESRRLLIRLHAQLGEHEYAIENGRAYFKMRPGDYSTKIIVAQSMVRLGMVDQARELLDEIPEDQRDVEAYFAMGRLAMVEGNLEASEAAFLKADEMSPHDSRVISSLLMVDSVDGDISTSIARIEAGLEANPSSAPLWRVDGLARLRQGDIEKAEAAFLKSLELDPSGVDNYAQLARIYAGSGRLDMAIEQYESAAEAQPENGTIRHFLGVLYEMTGKPDIAQGHYEEALQRNANLAETKNNLAYMLAEQGNDLDRALRLAQEAKAAMPDSPSAADTLGWVLYKRGVSAAAIGYLREAVSIASPTDPNLGEIRLHLSMAYEEGGDREKALETLEAAMSNLKTLKDSGKVSSDPAWAGRVREEITRLKAST